MDLTHLTSELRRRFRVDEHKERQKKRPQVSEDPFWVDSFHQIYVEKSSEERDDLLFIVRWDNKLNCEQVEVFRRDAMSLPSPRDESVLWEQTLYLNVILHEFEYYVTCGKVTVTDGVVDSVSDRVVQQVYPSPNQRSMDKKDLVSNVIYPDVMFYVDNFEEVFKDLYCDTPGEKIAVQLMASNKTVDLKKLVFLGAIDYSMLKSAYDKKNDAKPSGLGSKLRKMSFRSRSSRVFDLSGPYHFVRMRGPHSKGFAEMACLRQDLSLLKAHNSTPEDSTSHFFGTGKDCDPDESTKEHSTVARVETKVSETESLSSSVPPSKETEGGLSKLKSIFSRKQSDPPERRYSAHSGLRMCAYLTYLQLPWYSLIDDILNCTKLKAL